VPAAGLWRGHAGAKGLRLSHAAISRFTCSAVKYRGMSASRQLA
jgi:hypothetical protein